MAQDSVYDYDLTSAFAFGPCTQIDKATDG